MPRVSKLQLPFQRWPNEDRQRWENAFRGGDIFDEDKRGTHLSEATRKALRVSYAQYLRFLLDNHADLLTTPPKARLDRRLIAQYCGLLRKTNRDISIATSLHHLRLALKLMCPKEDWSWLSTITKRIEAGAPGKAKRYGLVSSEQLYLLGLELMDSAVAEAANQTEITKASAIKYRRQSLGHHLRRCLGIERCSRSSCDQVGAGRRVDCPCGDGSALPSFDAVNGCQKCASLSRCSQSTWRQVVHIAL